MYSSYALIDIFAATVSAGLSQKTYADANEWRPIETDFRQNQAEWNRMEMDWQKEDKNFRMREVAQRKLINNKREVDEKVEQLRSIASTAALIAGFSVVVLNELNFTVTSFPVPLLAVYAGTTAITVCLMTYSYLTSTLILVSLLKWVDDANRKEMKQAVSKFEEDGYKTLIDSYGPFPDKSDFPENSDFIHFWDIKCEDDWRRAFKAFCLMIPCFILNVVVAAFTKFLPLIVPPIVISVICGTFIFMLFWHPYNKWASYIVEPRVEVIRPD